MLLILQPLSRADAGVAERNNFLTQVLSLAEKPKAYFILDLGGYKITLMARGVAIREWAITRLQFAGDPLPVKTYLLEKKSIRIDDLRNNIAPDGSVVNNISITPAEENKTGDNKESGDKKVKKYEVIAMEINDMPTSYRLFLNEGITIDIMSQTEGSVSFLKNAFDVFKAYAYYPIREIWNSYHKKAHTEIEIFFKDKTEAQALFWAFTDETECIILPPGTEDREDYQL